MTYITVFTPVYNRVHTLGRLYKSLKRQTFLDFEWIVVDDGSVDESVRMIRRFQNEGNKFPILLVENRHGGKHRAVNTGVKLANGRLFFMLDSDDWLTENALETVIKWEQEIPKDSKCSGLCGCMCSPNGKMISRGLKGRFIYMPLTEMIKRGIDGDHADILYTDVFRKYLYPEIEGEFHIAPGVPFIRMANDGYNLLFFNEVIYIADYGTDGLTAMGDKKSLDNFKGYTLRSMELIKSDIGIKRKLQVLVKYCYLCKIKNVSIKDLSESLGIGFFVAIVGSVLGNLYATIKRRK